MLRRWKGATPGRPSRWDPPWEQPAAPTTPDRPPDWWSRRRNLAWVARRSRRWEPTFGPSGAPAPLISRARRIALAVTRRGHRWDAPPPGPSQPGWVRSRRPVASGRRGRRFDPPWGQAVETAPAWVAPIIQAAKRLAGRPVRRGDRFDPPWGQAVQTPPPWAPPQIRAARRPSGQPRRGDRFDLPAYGAALMPQFRSRRGRLWWGRWRGRRFEPTFALAPVPARVLRGRRLAWVPLRGSRFDPPWTAAAPQVQEGPPPFLRARRRAVALAVYGSRWNPPWAGAGIAPPPANVFSQLYDQHAGAVASDADSVPGQTSTDPVEQGAIEYHPHQLPGGIT